MRDYDPLANEEKDREPILEEAYDITSSEEPDTRERRVEIEYTRAELSATVEALSERLKPQHLIEQAKEQVAEQRDLIVDHAKEAVREATIGRAEQMIGDVSESATTAGSSLIDTIRGNPVPAALVGLGLAWLWSKRQSQPGYQRGHCPSPGPSRTGGYGGVGREPSYYGAAPSSGLRYGNQTRGAAQDSGQGLPGQVMDRGQDVAERVLDQGQEVAGRVMDRVQDTAGNVGSTATDVGSVLMETIKQNPVPALLAGLSLGWLYLNRPSDGSRYAYRSPYDSYDYGSMYERDRHPADDAEGVSGRVGEIAGHVQDTASDMASGAQQAVSELAGQAQETVGQYADQAQEKAGQLANQASYRARRTEREFERMVSENPLAIGVVALGLGVAAGLMVPSTDQENRLMGSARDGMLEKAQKSVVEVGEKIQRVAQEAGKAAQEEARSQNLPA